MGLKCGPSVRCESGSEHLLARCLRSLVMTSTLAFLEAVRSFRTSAATCFPYFFASRCFRLWHGSSDPLISLKANGHQWYWPYDMSFVVWQSVQPSDTRQL